VPLSDGPLTGEETKARATVGKAPIDDDVEELLPDDTVAPMMLVLMRCHVDEICQCHVHPGVMRRDLLTVARLGWWEMMLISAPNLHPRAKPLSIEASGGNNLCCDSIHGWTI
jgi:hypothetical protein